MSKPRLTLPVLVGILIVVAVMTIMLTLPGCSTQPTQVAMPSQGVCAFMHAGTTEQGAQVFRYICRAE